MIIFEGLAEISSEAFLLAAVRNETKTSAEVHEALSIISVLTNKEEHFLPVNDQDKGIVICTCYTNIACLCNDITDLFIDGTLYEGLAEISSEAFLLAAVRNETPLFFRSQASWLCSFTEFNTTFTSASVRILALQFALLSTQYHLCINQ
jgi:hypothetical protein